MVVQSSSLGSLVVQQSFCCYAISELNISQNLNLTCTFLGKALFPTTTTTTTTTKLCLDSKKSPNNKTPFPFIIRVNASFIQTPVLWAGRVCIFYALLKSGLAGSPSSPLLSDLETGVADLGFSKWIQEFQSQPEKDAADKRKLVSKWHPTTKGTLRRNYRIPSKSEGMRLLRSIASLLSEDDQFRDVTSHKGCQIRRESAHGESVCCNNVRALFDELPTPHLVVEITPFPAGPLTQKDYDKAQKLERVLSLYLAFGVEKIPDKGEVIEHERVASHLHFFDGTPMTSSKHSVLLFMKICCWISLCRWQENGDVIYKVKLTSKLSNIPE